MCERARDWRAVAVCCMVWTRANRDGGSGERDHGPEVWIEFQERVRAADDRLQITHSHTTIHGASLKGARGVILLAPCARGSRHPFLFFFLRAVVIEQRAASSEAGQRGAAHAYLVCSAVPVPIDRAVGVRANQSEAVRLNALGLHLRTGAPADYSLKR
jgi:hypothetical protein